MIERRGFFGLLLAAPIAALAALRAKRSGLAGTTFWLRGGTYTSVPWMEAPEGTEMYDCIVYNDGPHGLHMWSRQKKAEASP